MVGGVDATAGLQKTSLGQKRQKPFFEGKNLVPRGTGYVCLDKADTVIDGYPAMFPIPSPIPFSSYQPMNWVRRRSGQSAVGEGGNHDERKVSSRME